MLVGVAVGAFVGVAVVDLVDVYDGLVVGVVVGVGVTVAGASVGSVICSISPFG